MNSQDLNQSRFLFQELNLDDEPTQEEVIERAQQLEIEDLDLARESLTRQLDPQWKPYCNRKGEVYYINFLTKKAYIDHPIDMIYKQLYAKRVGQPLPKFRTFRIQDVANSMHLIKDEISSYQRQTRLSKDLNIVYEQPSEQQKQSIARSHSIHRRLQSQIYEEMNERQEKMAIQQQEELINFEIELQRQYSEKIEEYRLNRKQKYRMMQKQLIRNIQKNLEQKTQQETSQYQKQLVLKNCYDQNKVLKDIDRTNQNQQTQYYRNIQNFKSVFQQLRNKQLTISNLLADQQSLQKILFIKNISNKQQVLLKSKLNKLKTNLGSQFNCQLIKICGTSELQQKKLKQQLDILFDSTKTISENNYKIRKYERPCQDVMKKVEILKDHTYQKEQIQNEANLWTKYNIKYDKHQSNQSRLHLFHRLQLKIV